LNTVTFALNTLSHSQSLLSHSLNITFSNTSSHSRVICINILLFFLISLVSEYWIWMFFLGHGKDSHNWLSEFFLCTNLAILPLLLSVTQWKVMCHCQSVAYNWTLRTKNRTTYWTFTSSRFGSPSRKSSSCSESTGLSLFHWFDCVVPFLVEYIL
jgi:hypothetical protein